MFKVNSRNGRKKTWNMFKINNEDSKATSLTWDWCLYC